MSSAPPRILLASTSRYRRELLARLAVPFDIAAPHVDEAHLPGETPPQRASRLALAKAQAVAALAPAAVVIGSDQVAVCGESILDKPASAAACQAQLAQLSGGEARFLTAVAVACAARGYLETFTDTTVVRFRTLTAEEIRRYVELEAPYDCAGGFRSEGLGVALFESVESRDPTGLIGLPLIRVAACLRALGHSLP